MKIIVAASIATLLISAVPVYASHELGQPAAQQEPADTHISWHEFRHELGAYASVTASMDHHGVITLGGNTDSATKSRKLANLAKQVRGATEVKNAISAN